MIARKTNPLERMPDYCIQRHHCLRKGGRCAIGCSSWDFTPRKGDAHRRRNAERADGRA